MRTVITFTILLCANLLAAQGPFNCTAEAYLFQYNDVYSINLASGQAVLEAEDLTPGNINAAAYNPADGYIWGSLTSPDQAIVRVGLNMTTDTYTISGFPTANPYVGAISPLGEYYVKSGGVDFHVVDLDPGSSSYLEVIENKSLDQNISIADWAFNSVDGALYTVTNSGGNKLCRIDPQTAEVTILGEVPILSGLNYTYGAVYFDVDGNFYVSANQTGTIYIINAVQDITTNGVINSNLFSFGPASASNDGARCPTAPVPQEICDNGIDDDGDGLVDCDDPSCSGVSSCPVSNNTSGGNNGGLESNNRMSELIAERNYNRTLSPSPATIGVQLLPNYASLARPTKNQSMVLRDLVPIGIINESEALESSPQDLIDITNASEVFAVDYKNDSGNVASVLALKTEDGVYEHSKFICDRLLGAELNSVSTIFINELAFTKSIIYRSDGKREFVLSFAVRHTGSGVAVESHWNLDGYTVDEDYYNFQIWTSKIDDLITLTQGILDLVEVHQPIVQYEISPPPFVFVQRARVENGKLVLKLMNNNFSKELIVRGGLRRTETETFEAVEERLPLVPYRNEISLEIGYFFDFGMRLSSDKDGTADDLFVSDGPWGYDATANSTELISYEVTRTDLRINDNNFPLNRGIQLRAETEEYISTYRALTPRFEPVDLSTMNKLSFEASGSGNLEVTLISNSVTVWEQQFKAEVSLSKEPENYDIPKGAFSNSLGEEPDWSDIKMIVFTSRAQSGAVETIEIALSNVEFSRETISSVSDPEGLGKLIYPNPADDYINIDQGEIGQITAIEIYDVQGKTVLSAAGLLQSENILKCDLSKMDPGVYTLVIESATGRHTEKLVVAQ